MSENLTNRKILPRNLTARADKWVRGNPVTVRPESGVDNCYPGLEFDQRNLDKRFFPGLEFEFHGIFPPLQISIPPLLRSVSNEKAGRDLPIEQADVGQSFDKTIYLWAVWGTFGTMTGPQRRVERFSGLDGTGGLSAWRVVHDLEPGPIALLLARRAAEGGIDLDAASTLEAETALQSGQDLVRRENDRLVFAVLSGERAEYLVDGVINPDLYEVGDLSRSLCAPWQYDFTDCGCFYWASNKPDLVALNAEGPQLYNFQRAVRGPGQERPVAEVLDDRTGLLTFAIRDFNPGGWSTREPEFPGHVMNYQALLNDWEVLNPVFDHAESPRFTPEPATKLPPADVLPRAEVLRRLRYLATVEHGLMVEYLYAHYSVDAPRTIPGTDLVPARNFDIARSVLSVAIDEMRHFRWVNEILRELGHSMELGRVGMFEDLDGDARFISHDFALKPLSAPQLDWFIDVERPSDQVDPDKAGDTIDGLYTRLLLSIRQGTDFSEDERARLLHLIKLIIDEGFDHFTRFSNVRVALAGIPAGSWLRAAMPENPRPLADGHPAKVAEIVADRAYSTVLSALGIVFSMSNSHAGDFLQAARYAMYALDDAAHEVITLGGAPLFTLPETGDLLAGPSFATASGTPEDRLRTSLVAPMETVLDDLRSSGSGAVADSMQKHYARMIEEMARLM
ncbi:ferritin-like domain-containing protein [uncultured Roseibium sp.]|uniref:ferritin-like domain-containing protein n=1 Tax=uncultured Roseibium sp. TaxID=1936171 RepID=UPI002624CE7B|nr:ferritin-like domain-containing protein [uncultured Roseibium sp.]